MRIARPLRARIRIHVVTRNDVHPHIGRRPAHVRSLAPLHRHRRLAATVVEQVHIRIAEMPIRQAVNHIVKARLGQPNPGGRVEHSIRHRRRRMIRQHNAERQPERNEYQKTVEIRARQRQIPRIRQARLKVRLSHETLHVHNDPDVSVECQHQRQQDQNRHNRRLIRLHIVVGRARAIVHVVDVENELHAGGQTAHQPNQQQQHGDFASVEKRRYILRRAEA